MSATSHLRAKSYAWVLRVLCGRGSANTRRCTPYFWWRKRIQTVYYVKTKSLLRAQKHCMYAPMVRVWHQLLP